jgi:hypothetical protein
MSLKFAQEQAFIYNDSTYIHQHYNQMKYLITAENGIVSKFDKIDFSPDHILFPTGYSMEIQSNTKNVSLKQIPPVEMIIEQSSEANIENTLNMLLVTCTPLLLSVGFILGTII